MSEDPVRKYLDAKDKLDIALSKVNELKSIVSYVAKALNESPYSFIVSNVDVGFPAEVAMGGAALTLNADKWPSAKQIAEALAQVHECHNNAINLYASLSDSDKKNVAQLPPKRM